MKKGLFSLLLILHIFFLATSMARPTPRKAASFIWWSPIENVSDPAVQSMGSYAVSEYDNTTTLHLEFIKVVNGSTMYISFWPRAQKIWLLWVEAKNCTNPDQSHIYQTQVYENFGFPAYGGAFPGYYSKTFSFLQKLG